MDININQLYTKFKSIDITFNSGVIASLGLIVNKISFKCGGNSYPCILYSSTMQNARILAHLDGYFFELLRKNKQLISLRLTFKPKEQKSDFSFFINSKVKNFNQYHTEKSDLYFLNIEFLNKPPDDFIIAMGNYIEEELSLKKRIFERIVLNSDYQDTLGMHPMENFFFADGKGKRCHLTEISIFSAKILINCTETEYKTGQMIMLLLKMKGLEGMGEMFGTIEQIETINKGEGLFSIVIQFDQERIPPAYKMWIGECIEILKGTNRTVFEKT